MNYNIGFTKLSPISKLFPRAIIIILKVGGLYITRVFKASG